MQQIVSSKRRDASFHEHVLFFTSQTNGGFVWPRGKAQRLESGAIESSLKLKRMSQQPNQL